MYHIIFRKEENTIIILYDIFQIEKLLKYFYRNRISFYLN